LDDKDFYYYYGKTKLCFINDYYKNVIQVKINNKKLHFFNINLRKIGIKKYKLVRKK